MSETRLPQLNVPCCKIEQLLCWDADVCLFLFFGVPFPSRFSERGEVSMTSLNYFVGFHWLLGDDALLTSWVCRRSHGGWIRQLCARDARVDV